MLLILITVANSDNKTGFLLTSTTNLREVLPCFGFVTVTSYTVWTVVLRHLNIITFRVWGAAMTGIKWAAATKRLSGENAFAKMQSERRGPCVTVFSERRIQRADVDYETPLIPARSLRLFVVIQCNQKHLSKKTMKKVHDGRSVEQKVSWVVMLNVATLLKWIESFLTNHMVWFPGFPLFKPSSHLWIF